MQTQSPAETARALVQRHGARAAAVAQEHASENQATGDMTAFEHWQAVLRAVEVLRKSGRKPNQVH